MMMKIKGTLILLSAICWMQFAATPHARAADAAAAADPDSSPVLDEVVVTAQRREQRLQDVPIAVSSVSGGFLDRIGAEQLQDYFAFVPGVNLASSTLGERGGQNIIIRGISNTRLVGTDASSLSATTGFYLNDIPMTPVDVDLFDTSRVEVLRGPQGTLYGAASMGGAVKLYMNEPDSHAFSSSAEAKLETYKDGEIGDTLSGMVNLPIIDGVLAARLVGQRREEDGYIDTVLTPLSNTTPNTSYPYLPQLNLSEADKAGQTLKDTNSSTSSGVRLALLYTPNDNLKVEPAVLWQRAYSADQSSYDGYYGPNLMTEKATLEPNLSEISLTSLNASYNFGSVTLTSETGYYTRHYEETLDRTLDTYNVEGGAAVLGPVIPAIAYGVNIINWNTLTQELRLQSNNSGSDNSWYSRLNWVVGAFVMNETRTGSQYVQAPGWSAAEPLHPMPLANDFLFANTWDDVDKNAAVFADATYALTQHLTVAAGLRYFDESTHQVRPLMDAADTVVPDITYYDDRQTGTSPRYNVSYKFNKDYMVYATVSEGFRLGGGTIPLNFKAYPECLPVVEENHLEQFASGKFNSDIIWNYEAGVKSSYADGRMTLNMSAYRMNWTDLQQQISLAAFPGSLCNSALTANVGAARSQGVEMELSAAPVQNLLVEATASVGSAKITDPGEGVTLVQRGTPLQNVPDHLYSLAASYTFPLAIRPGANAFVRADARYVGSSNAVTQTVISDPLLELDAYTLVGLHVGMRYDRYTTTLYCENLLNEIPQLNAYVRPGVPQITDVTTSMPRTIGISLRVDY
jgi:iron complex outermembrane recepter protein